MFLGRLNISERVQVPLFMVGCALHGLMFGWLYAPAQALMFGLNFHGMIAWAISGVPADIIHATGNFAIGSLIVPLHLVMKKLKSGQYSRA